MCARIELVVNGRQPFGGPAAVRTPWCYPLRVLLSGVPLQDRTGTSGVTDRRAGHYTRGTVDCCVMVGGEDRKRSSTLVIVWSGERESNPPSQSGALRCFRNTFAADAAGARAVSSTSARSSSESCGWGRTGLHRLASGYRPDALLTVSYAPRNARGAGTPLDASRWSLRQDLNLQSSGSGPDALTRLSHSKREVLRAAVLLRDRR